MRKNIENKAVAFVLALTSLLVSSCSREMIPSGGDEPKMLSFNASMDDALSKTFLDGTKVCWELDDPISLWYGTLGTKMTQSNYFVGKIDSSDPRKATLNGLAKESSNYIAVYPRTALTSCSTDGTLSLVSSTEQNIREQSFGKEANLSVAYSTTKDLTFQNLGGMLAFDVTTTGRHTVMDIRLSGTSAMSGEFEMAHTFSIDLNGTTEGYSNTTKAGIADEGKFRIKSFTEGINFVSLDCGDGIKDDDTLFGRSESYEEEQGSWGTTKSATPHICGSGPYYLVSLPSSHTGFVLTFIDSDGKAARLKSNHAFTVERNSNTLIANVSLTDEMFKSDPQVYINEVDCKNKKIELYNPNAEAVDLSGWLLTKDEHSWAFPIGSTIPAKGYCVVNCKQSDCSTGPMFGLSGDKGFDLKLSNGGLVDRIDNLSKITVIGNTETFGRKTDGSAEWVVFSKGTIYNGTTCDGDNSKGTIKGEEPVVPCEVVLNEIDGNVKFVELFNKGTETISLEGWTLYKDEEQVWLGAAAHSIAAGSYFTIYSSKCSSIPAGAPTFSGGISPKKSVRVDIKNADGKTADTFTRGSSPWGSDMSSCSDSFGRTPDGTGAWKLISSTPNAANGASKGDIPQS